LTKKLKLKVREQLGKFFTGPELEKRMPRETVSDDVKNSAETILTCQLEGWNGSTCGAEFESWSQMLRHLRVLMNHDRV
jgi:hypothetical protein